MSMTDFLQALRMKQLFPVEQLPNYGEEVNPVPQVDNTNVNASSPYDVASRMKELYTPQTQAADRYNSLVQSQPEYEKPGLLRTIGASLAAFGNGGTKAADQIIDFNNNRNMTQWKNNLVPAEKAADDERLANANERTLAHTTVSNELKARAEEAKEKNNKETNAIRLMRAKVYEHKALNPNMKFVFPPGGNVIAYDPSNPNNKVTLTDDDGNPIPSGKISDTDKINLGQKNKMALQNDKQAGDIELENTKQPNRMELAETRGWEIGSVPDPNDPTKQIGMLVNKITGDQKPIDAGVFTKAGTPGKGANGVQPANLQAIQNKTQETINVLDQLIDKEGKLQPGVEDNLGKKRYFFLHHVNGSKQMATENTIKQLKNMLVVDLIGEMKAQSKTGSTGFGALNLRELEVLLSAATKLDPADEVSFVPELKSIRERLTKILQPADGMSNTTVPAGKPKRTPEDMWKQYQTPGAP